MSSCLYRLPQSSRRSGSHPPFSTASQKWKAWAPHTARVSPLWAVWTRHASPLRTAYIVSGHCLSQNVIHCRKSKYQISVWDFHILRGRGSLHSESFHFLPSKKIGNEYKREFKQMLLWRTAIIISIAYGNSLNHVEKVKIYIYIYIYIYTWYLISLTTNPSKDKHKEENKTMYFHHCYWFGSAIREPWTSKCSSWI